jgi:hypothetical protein
VKPAEHVPDEEKQDEGSRMWKTGIRHALTIAEVTESAVKGMKPEIKSRVKAVKIWSPTGYISKEEKLFLEKRIGKTGTVTGHNDDGTVWVEWDDGGGDPCYPQELELVGATA